MRVALYYICCVKSRRRANLPPPRAVLTTRIMYAVRQQVGIPRVHGRTDGCREDVIRSDKLYVIIIIFYAAYGYAARGGQCETIISGSYKTDGAAVVGIYI